MKKEITVFVLPIIISLVLSACNTVQEEVEERPNILFFLVDDQRNDLLSIAGHPIIQTPTVDKLAENGVRFTNAFVTTSICAASRASILTGLYESKHGYTFGKLPIKTEFVKNSYPFLLKSSGYKTGFIGKFGMKIENQDSLLPQMFDYYKPSPKSGPHFIKLNDGTKRHSAEIKGDEAVEFIANQTSENPFCLSISFNAVHAVDGNKTPGNDGHYPYPKAVEHLYEDTEMPTPELSDSNIYENHPEFLKNSLNRERYFWRWDTEEKYQTNMKAYFRMISGYDNVMKRVLNTLEKYGLDKNTIIIFSSDNGYYMGNRGFAGKWSHYEESLRVPLVIYDPRKSRKTVKGTSDKVALNIDIPSTILDLAGISLPEIYQGESLVPILNNEDIDTWRTDFLCEHRMEHDKIPKYVGIRGQRYIYANYYEQNPPYEYLHDLQKDPKQLENLIDDTTYKDVLQQMRSKRDSLEIKVKGQQ
ncbi:sulfatase [Maribacter sp. HTCC2170]|uniref:sulfatase family protein n=1 Tax=Maribacter sp. (strain HTCC2170 / KCCM 42371) TaxID=313603 RepID=UPI00006B4978|nr:sulfatase [Maribacter sp. HTCC2170]EAR00987.1 mucin-desulfating sulfatase (N-acetylglucosamine-6-sulfatase) [Maribacter sp. HTCC2170]